jgi:hypothetical protein
VADPTLPDPIAGADCPCCGAPEGFICACDVDRAEGYDPETGPWSELWCFIHQCRVREAQP